MQNMGDQYPVTEFSFLGYKLDTSKRCLIGPTGDEVTLSSRALDILILLVNNPGQTLSKTYLVEQVWPDAVVEENNLNQAISSLRKALDDSKSNSRFIKTVTGRGYCFVADIDQSQLPETIQIAPPILEDQASSATLAAETQDPVYISPSEIKPTGSRRYIYITLLLALAAAGSMYFQIITGHDPEPVFNDSILENAVLQQPPTPRNAQRISNSLAVLPLTDLTLEDDPEEKQTIFTQGLHDELIHQLGMMQDITLVSQESFLSPAINEYSLNNIGRLLNVESLLTGTILFQDSRARIILQLLEAETGVIEWTYAYEINTENFSDMLETQNQIALKIANVVYSGFNQKKFPEPARPTSSYAAYRYNVAARLAFRNLDFSKTWYLANKALSIDPEYVGAMYNFSKANSFMSIVPNAGMTTREHQELALSSAQKIADLAPELSDGYLLKAHALASLGRWEEATHEMRKLESFDSPIYDIYLLAPLLMSLGDFQGTIAALESNLSVQPNNAYGRGLLMAAYEASGNRLQARYEYEVGEELTPIWWGDTVNVFLAMGRKEKISEIPDLYKTPENIKAMLVDFNAGEITRLRTSLINNQAINSSASSEYIFYSMLAAAIGEPEIALDFMKKSTAEMAGNIFWFWLPVFHEARQLTGFKSLLKDLGIVTYWQEFGWPQICQPLHDSFTCD